MFYSSFSLLLLALFSTIIIDECTSENVEDVWTDCGNEVFKRMTCYGFIGTGYPIVSYDSCIFKHTGCYILLRAKVAEGHEGEWNLPLDVTIAVRHDEIVKQTSHVFLVLKRTRPYSQLSLQAFRTSNGSTGGAVEITSSSKNGSVTIVTYPMSLPHEISGDSRSLLFTFTMPSTGLRVGNRDYTINYFTNLEIAHGTEDNYIMNPRAVLTEQQKFNIHSYIGYQYTGCGRTNLVCLSVTPTTEQQEECIRTATCTVLIRIKSTHKNKVELYLNRKLVKVTKSYISVGFSTNRSMGDALVFDCLSHGFTTIANLSFNEQYTNNEHNIGINIPSYNRMTSNNYFECSWTLTYNVSYSHKNYEFSLNNSYYIVRAVGGMMVRLGNFHKTKHTATVVTSGAVQISPQAIVETQPIMAAASTTTTTAALTSRKTRTTFATISNTTSELNTWGIRAVIITLLAALFLVSAGVTLCFVSQIHSRPPARHLVKFRQSSRGTRTVTLTRESER